ncbi:MAG TPA: ATP-binding protein [Lichenihabitans sp.]|nr:ATP-binding protein [Lichenihabitans sp.]
MNLGRTMVARLWRRPGGAWPMDRISTGLGLFGLAFILAMTGAIAWKTYVSTDREVRDHARRGASFLADHAGRLLEVADLALRASEIALGADDWSTIEASQRIRAEMTAVAAALPFVEDIWLNDQDGRLRLTTLAFPTPASSIADRPIFKTLEEKTDLVVGEPIVGKLTGAPTFLIARRMTWPDGRLRGIVSATTDLGYFTSYWQGLDLPDGERIALVRGGRGDLLVGYPGGAFGPGATPTRDLTDATAQHPDAGIFHPTPRETGFYRRVGSVPLYLVVVFSDRESVREWSAWFVRFVPFPVAAMLAVLAAIGLNLRHVRAETLARRTIEAARHDLSLSNARLEERVAERTADLRETNAEIQRFAYIVSHDLRAPLVNITGFTAELQMLRDDLFAPRARANPELVKDFDEAIGFIRTSIDKMDRLIKAILFLSRQGQRPFAPEPVDMDRLMRAVADDVAHRALRSGATIEIGRLPAVVSDPIALEQIFSNLIDNAVKYLRPGVPGRIEVEGERGKGSAMFTIRDNGRGIEAGDHARVFELFRRAGPQDQPGEGIGLAHVRALVRRLGGSISLASTPGGGSTFTVTLPLANRKGSS